MLRITKDPKIDVVEKTFVLDNGLHVEIGTFPNRRIIVEGIVVGRLSPTNDNLFGPEYLEGNPETEARNAYGGERGRIAFVEKMKELLVRLHQQTLDNHADTSKLIHVIHGQLAVMEKLMISRV